MGANKNLKSLLSDTLLLITLGSIGLKKAKANNLHTFTVDF